MRHEATPAERRLWRALRDRQPGGAKFRRQVPLAHYIADFVCFNARLIIEVDGGQHAESHGDSARTKVLATQGYRVLRFWNNEVMENLGGVLAAITGALNA